LKNNHCRKWAAALVYSTALFMAIRPSWADAVSDASDDLAMAIQSYAASPSNPNKMALAAALSAYNQAVKDNATHTLIDGTFSDNTATISGGAILNTHTATIAGSAFSGNTASSYGGAIYNDGSGQMTVAGSTFSGNTAAVSGGAISNFGTAMIADTTFSANTASTWGGAISNFGGTVTIAGSTFAGNTASAAGGAIFNDSTGLLTIADAAFSGNSAGISGGAIFSFGGAATIADATFRGNTASLSGGAIFNYRSTLGLTTSAGKVTLFSGNTAGGRASSIDFSTFAGNPDAVLNIAVDGGGLLDMRDPMGVEYNTGGIGINKIGAGTWALGGANDFTQTGSGKTSFDVAEGSLYLYAGGEVGNATGANPGATVAAGSIALAGSGSVFTLGGDATLIAAGSNSITTDGTIVLGDGATLRGGTAADATDFDRGHALIATGGATALDLDATNGVLLDGVLNVAALGAGDVFTLNADLAGNTGSLNKTGAGAVVLNGVNTYAGTTTVNAGKLVIGDDSHAGASLAGAVTVNSGAFLGGIGTIGTAGSAVTIAEGGVHAPGNSVGVQHVAGDYVNHGILRIEATPSEADRVVVAGSVDITGATLDLVLSPADAASLFNNPFTIIDKQSTGAVIGTFSPVNQNLLFLDALLDYQGGDGNDVTVELVRNATAFASVGQTRNQIATGTAVEGLGNANALWRSIAFTNDRDVVRASFDALSGEIHASTKTALIEDSRFVRDAMNDRIRAAFDGVAASHAPVLAYGPGDAPALVSPGHTGPVLWAYGFGAWGTTDGDGNAAGLNHSTGGLLIGADGLVGDWRIGFLAGYSHSRFDVKDRFSSGKSDNYHLGLYGGTQWGNLALRTGAAYTRHDIDTTRAVAIPGVSESLSADYNAGTFQAFGELGYSIDTSSTRFEPFANLAYVGLHSDSFAERGGAAALRGAGSNTDVTFTTLGLRAQHDIALGTVEATISGLLGWQHAFGDTTPQSTQAFATGSAFSIAGAPIARNAAVIEAGLDLNLTPQATFGLSYAGQFATKAQDHGFKANLTVSF